VSINEMGIPALAVSLTRMMAAHHGGYEDRSAAFMVLSH
jgi:hypothetical protein